jgi:excisionase family DNA binding protein
MPSRQVRHLLSLKEAAERLDICTKTLQRLIEARELPYVLVGRRRKIDSKDIERFIEDHKHVAPGPSISRPARRSAHANSRPEVYDFEAGRERRRKNRLARNRKQADEQ